MSSLKSLENKLQKFEVKGIREIYQGSNRVFLCELVNDEEKILSVYKPLKGEKPLVDFFSGNLYSREKAAYEISKFLDWPNLPPLVIREGPYGIGSFQKYIIHDQKENYFTLFESHKENLLKVIVFDFIILNTDRKAGSIILDENENIWSIDQALTFNPYTRFRTVMFEFSNQQIEEKIIQKVKQLSNELKNKAKIFKDLEKLISYEEMDYLITRCEELIKNKKLPILDPNYNVPYPLI